MSYGESFLSWRQACQPEWNAYTRHAFVEGMRDGTLPHSHFLNYLVQDYIFLKHFSRAWALAVTKTTHLDEMQACAATLHALLDHEMALHVGICAKAGIGRDVIENTPEAITSIAYTRFVLDAGHSGDFLDLLAALMPCVLGYGEIGLRLRDEAVPDTVYSPWIATYSGEEYQQACRQAGDLTDRAIRRRLGDDPQSSPRWAELSRCFATATRLEAAFWELGQT